MILSSATALSLYLAITLWRWRCRCAPRAEVLRVRIPSQLLTRTVETVPGHYIPFCAAGTKIAYYKDRPSRTGPVPCADDHIEYLEKLGSLQTLNDRVASLVAEFTRHIGTMTKAQFEQRYIALLKEWRDKGCPDYY